MSEEEIALSSFPRASFTGRWNDPAPEAPRSSTFNHGWMEKAHT